MERIRALINKLNEQSRDNADVSVMITTVQHLHFELTQLSSSAPKQMGTGKVAVMLPQSNKFAYAANDVPDESVARSANPYYPIPEAKITEPKPAEPVIKTEKVPVAVETRKQEQSGWLFDPVQDIPTLSHQKEFKEMNDVFGQYSTSLNDTLKTGKTELASVLTDGPVRDLKKAIGVNDRFVFLSELFRGDEAMYERSIKTINNFRIYPEAEYWIERELKVKLGWDEKKEVVKQFGQLVKRRFS